MKILIANPGSTSYKCKLFDMSTMSVLFQAGVERIGDRVGIYSYQFAGAEKVTQQLSIPDFTAAVNQTLDTLQTGFPVADVAAVGFKTVHAKGVTGCARLTEDVLRAMEDYLPLAPVHNRVYLTAISVFKKLLPQTPLIGLFETAFHSRIPPEAYLYGIPFEYFEKYGIRKYGFHGASHRYIGQRAKELYFPSAPSCKVISCHLGGSSSVCAIKDGVSVDTSMGMSPQSGLLNATRVGDFDCFALLYLMEKENLSIEQVRKMLISRGGVLGISGVNSDFRDVEASMQKGSLRDELAFDTFAYYVKRYIGEYMAVLNRADIIVFTGGAGQYSPALRKAILRNMENIGIVLDDERNAANPGEGLISAEDSSVKIAVIPTNEEWIVAREVEKVIRSQQQPA
ncbi:MAG: acetate/propionate family kinase [Candidatus Zhuqueibacterota bacterium]